MAGRFTASPRRPRCRSAALRRSGFSCPVMRRRRGLSVSARRHSHLQNSSVNASRMMRTRDRISGSSASSGRSSRTETGSVRPISRRCLSAASRISTSSCPNSRAWRAISSAWFPGSGVGVASAARARRRRRAPARNATAVRREAPTRVEPAGGGKVRGQAGARSADARALLELLCSFVEMMSLQEPRARFARGRPAIGAAGGRVRGASPAGRGAVLRDGKRPPPASPKARPERSEPRRGRVCHAVSVPSNPRPSRGSRRPPPTVCTRMVKVL